ncbi:MAG: hypothetical protein IKP47_08540 [Ruminococcus sp.]|nr:hypothetical protein [Ruminococcus sp.]
MAGGGKYDDIIGLSRPEDGRPRMSAHDRAAQFSPFAALSGFGESVDETARLTEERPELTEDRAEALNAVFAELTDRLPEHPEVKLTCFVPDRRKSGGSFTETSGRVRAIDTVGRELILEDGRRIPLDTIEELALTAAEEG